ncbi:hypothetical protein HGI30_16080 [Paenibacillus albicereus]|uniref:Uncharacterized protein n=1 Tax=Paenibacillus albicereus TaxID=2726185 RepID=A0A6H2H0J4_9BACL|nr:hypothetical protein [Paenibacillus albicereus]QJC52936.1 hypothetical protein HGI30_16080 [Paenibacillus albicereus]
MITFKRGEHEVLVTSDEVIEILNRVEENPYNSALYEVTGNSPDSEAKIKKYLEAWINRDESGFYNKFVYRDIQGERAKLVASAYLKRFSELFDTISLGNQTKLRITESNDDYYIVSINDKKSFINNNIPNKLISIKKTSIFHIQGTVSDFLIETIHAKISFSKDSIYISVL